MSDYLRRIVRLTKEQYAQIVAQGSITVDGVTYTYNANDLYLTDQQQELSIGTVETLTAGSDATATITGTAEQPVLNLGIPQGAQGETGPQGPEGPQGPAGAVQDVQVNGTSVVTNGVANVPLADSSTYGVVKPANGLKVEDGKLKIAAAADTHVKEGNSANVVLTPAKEDKATFYGLAKAAGDSTQASSDNAVGTYTEDAKSKISEMLGGSVAVSGSTPSITAKPGIRYVCGEVSTLDITAPANGCIDVLFASGSTATMLTVISAKTGVTAVKWTGDIKPNTLEANTTYEVNILDGEYGVIGAWT